MTLSTKTKVIISIIVILTAFAAGRYSVKAPTTKTQISQTQDTKTTEDKNTHKKITIIDTKQADGADTKTTVIDEVSNDDTTQNQDTKTQVTQTVTPPKTNTINISILGANDFGKGLLAPTYGLSVTKEVLGPITVGAFGLMNGTVGVSVGLDF